MAEHLKKKKKNTPKQNILLYNVYVLVTAH